MAGFIPYQWPLPRFIIAAVGRKSLEGLQEPADRCLWVALAAAAVGKCHWLPVPPQHTSRLAPIRSVSARRPTAICSCLSDRTDHKQRHSRARKGSGRRLPEPLSQGRGGARGWNWAELKYLACFPFKYSTRGDVSFWFWGSTRWGVQKYSKLSTAQSSSFIAMQCSCTGYKHPQLVMKEYRRYFHLVKPPACNYNCKEWKNNQWRRKVVR